MLKLNSGLSVNNLHNDPNCSSIPDTFPHPIFKFEKSRNKKHTEAETLPAHLLATWDHSWT